MKKERGKPAKRQLSPGVTILIAFTFLALAFCGVSPLLEEIKTGRAYTLGVMFADATKASKSESPAGFWMNMAWQIFGWGSMVVLGVGGIIQAIFFDHKKGAENAQNDAAQSR